MDASWINIYSMVNVLNNYLLFHLFIIGRTVEFQRFSFSDCCSHHWFIIVIINIIIAIVAVVVIYWWRVCQNRPRVSFFFFLSKFLLFRLVFWVEWGDGGVMDLIGFHRPVDIEISISFIWASFFHSPFSWFLSFSFKRQTQSIVLFIDGLIWYILKRKMICLPAGWVVVTICCLICLPGVGRDICRTRW